MNKTEDTKNNTKTGVKIVSQITMFVGLCIVLAGIAGYYHGRYVYGNKKETCTAVINGSVVVCDEQVVFQTQTRRHAASRRKVFFQVRYSYSVDDEKYTGSQRLTYNPGYSANVHYDPNNPKKSYIGHSPQDSYKTRLNYSILGGWVMFLGLLIPLRVNTPSIHQMHK